MKNTLFYIISFIIKFIPYYQFIEKKRHYKSLLTTLSVRNKFKKCSRNVSFRTIQLLKGCECISIGVNSRFDDFLYLTAWTEYGDQKFMPSIEIGENCNFGAFNHISSCNRIVIGDNCLTGKNVTIVDNNHGSSDVADLQISPVKRRLISKGSVIIGKNVWLGEKVTILPGVTIGDSVIVAANSVVTKDIPSYCVAGGNPAKIIRKNLS